MSDDTLKEIETHIRNKLRERNLTLSTDVEYFNNSDGESKLAFEAGKYSAYTEILAMIRQAIQKSKIGNLGDNKCT